MKCNQTTCDRPADYRFTWPGQDEKGICEGHAPKLKGVAKAIGVRVQFIPVEHDPTCHCVKCVFTHAIQEIRKNMEEKEKEEN